MRTFVLRLLLISIAAGYAVVSYSQVKTETSVLKRAAAQRAENERSNRIKLLVLAKERGWDTLMRGKKGSIASLARVDGFGMPLYVGTYNNTTSAATIGTDKLWPGGTTGLNLNGSSNSVKGKLAIWDGGNLRSTHVELTGRILQKDNAEISDHSTYVAGTMIASGVNPLAKGMSFGQQQLIAYSYLNNSDAEEMMDEAPNLLVSNHSYGSRAGWVFNNDRWEYYGPPSSTEDYKFGYYSSEAQLWDSIAYNAPYYLIVNAAGNSRDFNGPAVGQTYWRMNSSGTFVSANRPAGISNNDSYDIIATSSTAKNILVVGAINPINSVYSSPNDVVMSTFSSWGPTDDGRIKPDVVTDGVDVLSSSGTSNTAYEIASGTSASSPAAAGSLLLLQEYYAQLHGGTFMRAATLKGLAIHTTNEAGPSPGPDYQYGWGLLNMQKAAAVITANNTTDLIQEHVLNNGGTFSLPVIASGSGTLSATISWTDVKGNVEPEGNSALNNSTKRLVNDLDIVIKKGATTYLPWILNPSPLRRGDAATRGINSLDNVEKIELPDVIPGETYTIEVTHKTTLARGAQAFSLIVSGVSSQPYCASAATSNAGAKIDSVAFGGIKKKNIAGCTTYNNYTTLTGTIEPSQTIPLFVRLRSCDATTADKVVKAFIDFNNDGDFTDAGENIATSAVINGDGDFSANVTLPAGLTGGKYSVLRIVMEETNSAAAVTPCGNYTRGETQDYRILVNKPSTDVGIVELVSPEYGECASGEQYVSVRIRNFGASAKTNIPLSVVIKQGATTINTLTATFAGTVAAGEDAVYTFQTPFISAASGSYSFTSATSLAGDQNTANNEHSTTIAISANGISPAGTAVICNTNISLKVSSPVATDLYTWYTSPTAAIPIATGSSTTTATNAATYYLARNDASKKLGPPTKLTFPKGSYNIFNDDQPRLLLTTTTALTLDRARLYIGQPGKIKFSLRRVINFSYLDGSYSYYPAFDTSYTIDAYATAPTTPVPGEANNDPADAGAIYRLGINIPDSGQYIITMQSDDASIYRNNEISGTNYPYSIPGIITLNGNGAVDGTDPNLYKQFYYFFYDMSVKLYTCASNRVAIVPTTPTAPVITLNGNQLSSSSVSGNQWYLNGNIVAGAVGQTYTPVFSGTYTVKTTTNGCVLVSNGIPFVATALPNIDPSQIGLIVSPNPAPAGHFNLQLETRTRANLDISLINTLGQKVYTQNTPGFIGRLTESINPGKIAPGIYYLQVVHDKKRYIKKIIVVE